MSVFSLPGEEIVITRHELVCGERGCKNGREMLPQAAASCASFSKSFLLDLVVATGPAFGGFTREKYIVLPRAQRFTQFLARLECQSVLGNLRTLGKILLPGKTNRPQAL